MMSNVSVHDSHNIEIKNSVELIGAKTSALLDIYMFIPRGFNVISFKKSDVFEDIRSKMRFSFCDLELTGSHNLLLAIDTVASIIENKVPYDNEHYQNQLTLEIRKLSNIIQEQFKKSFLQKKLDDVLLISTLLDKVRSITNKSDLEVIRLFDEFTSQTYVQFLISLEDAFPNASELKELKIKEAIYRELKGYLIQDNSSSADLESKLTQMSLMKKYFQSHSFVEIKQNTRFSPMRLLSRIIPKSPFHFSKLVISGKPFAKVQEWVFIKSSSELHADIIQKRTQCSQNKLEGKIPEDVIHYRKKIKIAGYPNFEIQNKPFKAINDTLRVNIERYLKLMDDPIKDFYDVSMDGNLKKFQSQKVYHFYVVVSFQQGNINRQSVFRATINKNGILKIDNPDLSAAS